MYSFYTMIIHKKTGASIFFPFGQMRKGQAKKTTSSESCQRRVRRGENRNAMPYKNVRLSRSDGKEAADSYTIEYCKF